jgi:hypothetical protein
MKVRVTYGRRPAVQTVDRAQSGIFQTAKDTKVSDKVPDRGDRQRGGDEAPDCQGVKRTQGHGRLAGI